MTSSNGCACEPGSAEPKGIFTASEIRYLKRSWDIASSTIDIGCELVARLLNDNRTSFRALIESHTGDLLGSTIYSREDVKKIPRARAVGNGVVTFLNEAIAGLDGPNADEFIALHSQRLGASHFRMKVWFQAENWLCVKNCLLESIMTALSIKHKTLSLCGRPKSMDTKKGREVWFRVIQFVIHNMKKGFLTEALAVDTSSSSSTSSA